MKRIFFMVSVVFTLLTVNFYADEISDLQNVIDQNPNSLQAADAYFSLGSIFQKNNNYLKSDTMLFNCMNIAEITPELNNKCFLELGENSFFKNQYSEAQSYLNQLINTELENKAKIVLSEIKFDMLEFDTALNHIADVIQDADSAETSQAFITLGNRISFLENRGDTLYIPVLNQYLDDNNLRADYLIHYSKHCFITNNYIKVRQLLGNEPFETLTYDQLLYLGLSYLYQNFYSKSLEVWAFMKTQTDDSSEIIDLTTTEAYTYNQQQEFAASDSVYNHILEDLCSGVSDSVTASVKYMRAANCSDWRHYTEAAGYYTDILENGLGALTEAEVRFARAEIYRLSENYETALTEYEYVISNFSETVWKTLSEDKINLINNQ